MRVLYVINGLGTGGAERSLSEMLPYLGPEGIDLTVAMLFRKREGVELGVRRNGYDARQIPPGRMLQRLRNLRSLIHETGAQLVHTTIFEADVLGRIAAAGTGVPVLTSLVNASYDPVRLQDSRISRNRLLLARLIDGWTARCLTTHFHAITHAVKQAAVESLHLRADRITVVERGRDRNRLGTASADRRAAVRGRLELAPGAEVLVNVGRQEFQKGQQHLLQAFETIAAIRPNAVLLIAGRTGNASSDLERLRASSAFADRIHFLGHRDDVPDLLAAADVFVFPSLYEGLGGALIEALALGVPIVASRIPAIEEVLDGGRTGVLVEKSSPAALAYAVQSLLDSPDRAAELAMRGRRVFEERFTIERSARRMVELYRRLAGVAQFERGTPAAATVGAAAAAST